MSYTPTPEPIGADAGSVLTMRPAAPIWLTCVRLAEVRLAAIAADLFAALIGARADSQGAA
jgi:hypothetical protein